MQWMLRCRPRVAVLLVILALLVFTTVCTSPITGGSGPGTSLSQTTPKQRHLAVRDVGWTAPVEAHVTLVALDCGRVVAVEFDPYSHEVLFPRCTDLPPPVA